MGLVWDLIEKAIEQVLDLPLDKRARAEFREALSKADILFRRSGDAPDSPKLEFLYEAIPLYQFAIGRNGRRREKAAGCLSLGRCYERLEWWQEAKRAYEECVGLERRHREARVRLACACAALQDYGEAVRALRKHLRIHREDAYAAGLLEAWGNATAARSIQPQDLDGTSPPAGQVQASE